MSASEIRQYLLETKYENWNRSEARLLAKLTAEQILKRFGQVTTEAELEAIIDMMEREVK